MSIRRVVSYAMLGVGLMTALPAVAEEQEKNFLEQTGIGVVAKIGNNRAESVKLFAEDRTITPGMKATKRAPEVAALPRTFLADPDSGGDK